MFVSSGRKACWMFLGLLVLALVGCGSATVTGTVTYNGQPISKGKITFLGVEENSTAVGTDIENGKYTLKDIAPGTKKVSILVQEIQQGEPGQKDQSVSLPAVAPGDLAVDVVRGQQEHDFPLKELLGISVKN